MFIMDRQDYLNKSNNLLNQPTNINTIKNKLINKLKRVKSQTDLESVTYKSMYPKAVFPPSSMGFPKSTNQTHHKGLLCPVVDQSPMVWLENLPRSLNLW